LEGGGEKSGAKISSKNSSKNFWLLPSPIRQAAHRHVRVCLWYFNVESGLRFGEVFDYGADHEVASFGIPELQCGDVCALNIFKYLILLN
jgi:hypothetical protein